MLNTPRYGRKIRKKYVEMQRKAKSKYECPKCGKIALKRVSFAIWVCKSCGAKIAGGAYQPNTDVGLNALRILSNR